MAVGYLGTAVKDEQQAVDRLSIFLLGLGWSIAQDVTDTGSDRDIVFSSPGEPDVPNGLTRYIRLRGTSNAIALHTYETFVDTGTNTGEVTDATYGKITTEGDAQGFSLMAVADLERVVIQVETYNEVRYIGYVGRINSYYTAQQFNQPNLVKGGQATTYDWYYSAAERNSWMRAPEGTQAHYYAIEPVDSTGLTAGQTSDRNGSMFLSAPVLVRVDADTNKSELVGEPRGVYRLSPEVSQNQMFLTIDEDTYVVFNSNSKSWAVGPVAVSGTGAPSLFSDLTG